MTSAPGPILREVTIRQNALRRQQQGRPYWGTSWPWRIAVVVAALLLLGGGVAIGRFVLHGKTMSIQAETAPLFQQAYVLQNTNKLTAAEQTYLRVLKLDPTNKFAYYDLGVIYQETAHAQPAALAYEKALLVDPNYQPALYNLAYLETSSDPVTAIALYEKLQKLKPQNPAAVAFNLGLVLRSVGKRSQGDEELNYAIRLDPSLASKVPAKDRPITSSTTTVPSTTSTT